MEEHRATLARTAPIFHAHELADTSPSGRRLIVEALRRHLVAERQRGLAGHWAYDLARHAATYRAYRREIELLEEAESDQRCAAR